MTETEEKQEAAGFWALVEVMGHRKFAGYVSEFVMGGASFVRIDVPPPAPGESGFTKMFGAGSIYCITPVVEDVARAQAARFADRPVSEWDLPDEWRQAISQGRLQFQPAEDAHAREIREIAHGLAFDDEEPDRYEPEERPDF